MSLEPYDPENPPAFPVMVKTPNGVWPEGGLSMREWYAGMVLQGMFSNPAKAYLEYTSVQMAENAFIAADAMMQARKPKTP